MRYGTILVMLLVVTRGIDLRAYTSTIDNKTQEDLQVSVKTGTYNPPLIVPAGITYPKVYGGYCFYAVDLAPLSGNLAHSNYEYVPPKVPYCDNLALRVTKLDNDLKLEKK